MSTPALSAVLPPPPTFKYGAIIDAGSTSSRIYVYKWETGSHEKPLSVTKVFPSNEQEESRAVNDGGIQTKGQDQGTMDDYLGPLLRAAEQFLTKELPDRNHLTANVPLYLIATGGMRSIPKADQDRILDMAYQFIATFEGAFNTGHRETTVRVIPGELEGLFAWVALNYARESTDPLFGLAEMGGASIQFAFEDHSERANKTRVCLPSKRDGYDVYSATWDGYGAFSMRQNMLQLLSNHAGSDAEVIHNPCLPLGAPGKPVGIVTRPSVGTGNFEACFALAKHLLVESEKSRAPIPSYPAIQPMTDTNNVLALSSFWYDYEFFSQYGRYDVKAPYDPILFEAAVRGYCSHKWGTLPTNKKDKYIEGRCFEGAWMLRLLHNRKHGFGLETLRYNQTSKGLLLFPTSPTLVDRSSWTMGVAELMAEYDGLIFCPGDDELSVARLYPTTTDGRKLPAIVPPTVYPISDYNRIESSTQTTGELGLQLQSFSFVSGLGCGIVLLALLLFGYRNISSRFSSGKIRLPPDVEDGEGKEECRELMDAMHGL